MTAPMTPPGPHPYPPFPGDGKPAPGDTGGGYEEPGVVGDVRSGVLAALAVGLGGVLLGVLWLWLAPRVPLISDGEAIYLKDSESEAPIGGDGMFVLLGLGLGAVSSALVFWRCRKGGVAVVVGLAAGGLLASLLGMLLGVWLGPSGDVVARAREIGAGEVFDAPLELKSKAALLAWPIGAMIVHLLLTGAFGPRDEPPPGHGGWDDRKPATGGNGQDGPAPGAAPYGGGGDDPWAPPRR